MLGELISSIAKTVKPSQGRTPQHTEVIEEPSFDLEKALFDEEKPLSFKDYSAASKRDEYERKRN